LKSIIPIAGTDYFKKDFCKGLIKTEKGPLLKSVLQSRPWIKEISELIFVCIESKISRDFFKNYLKKWFPNCKVVYLSSPTAGAALSMLAGLSIASDRENEPIIIDLADIYFETDFIPYKNLENNGYAFTFRSNSDQYSYFELDNDFKVIKAVEKKPISQYASAGVYTFPSCSELLKALAFALNNAKQITYNDLFYVCPIMNYLIEENIDIKLIEVKNCIDFKF